MANCKYYVAAQYFFDLFGHAPEGEVKSLALFCQKTGTGSRVYFRRITKGGYPRIPLSAKEKSYFLAKPLCLRSVDEHQRPLPFAALFKYISKSPPQTAWFSQCIVHNASRI